MDEYIESFGEPARGRLHELRALSRAGVPHAVEELKWGSPAYTLGTILFVFSGHKDHANFVVTPSTLAAFTDELDGYTTGKGRGQLPYGVPIPTASSHR